MNKNASQTYGLLDKLLILSNAKLVSSCEDLERAGVVDPGYFLIKTNDGGNVTVYCNFGRAGKYIA